MGPTEPQLTFRPMPARRKWLLLVAGALALAVLWLGALAVLRPERIVPDAATVPIGGPFTLVDQDGRTVTDAQFRGKVMLVYFGYTWCPDICPTSLLSLSEALEMLGPRRDQVAFLFISVDPARDTPAVLKDYVASFAPPPTGLTGSAEAVDAAAKAYRVYYRRHDGDDPDSYLMDHSTMAYLMDREGRFIRPISHGTTPEDAAGAISSALEGGSS